MMSTYNGEKYLIEQLESIFAQKTTGVKIDLLVRDDGSTDNTVDILKKYEMEGKLSWYSGYNLKPAKSFIDLLFKSGDYDFYAFADQDDIWKEDKLEKAIMKIHKMDSGPIVYYSNAYITDQKLNIIGKVYNKVPDTSVYTIICAANIIGCTMVFNNALASLIKCRAMPKIVVMHDSYICRVCSSIGGQVVFENEGTMYYRQHENNVLGIRNNFFNKIKLRISDVFVKPKITVDEQMGEIVSIYSDLIKPEYYSFIKMTCDYKKSIVNRIRLVISKKPKYISKNMSLKYRLSFLLGNR